MEKRMNCACPMTESFVPKACSDEMCSIATQPMETPRVYDGYDYDPACDEYLCNDDACDHDQDNIAMAYVPSQQWRKIYSCCDALERGTIFFELDMPFIGRGVNRE